MIDNDYYRYYIYLFIHKDKYTKGRLLNYTVRRRLYMPQRNIVVRIHSVGQPRYYIYS